MAYENQDKCEGCGTPIPPMPEDATVDERLCDVCNEAQESFSESEEDYIKNKQIEEMLRRFRSEK